MTRTVLTPQMPPSWMRALAEGKGERDVPCTSCNGKIDVVSQMLVGSDEAADEIWVALERCQSCSRRPLGIRRELGDGGRTLQRRPTPLTAWDKLAALIAVCPNPSDAACGCEGHLKLRACDAEGRWVGLERFLASPTEGTGHGSLRELATMQLRVARLLLDWVRVDRPLGPQLGIAARRGRGDALSAAAEEAAAHASSRCGTRPENVAKAAWTTHVALMSSWAEANAAIAGFASVRGGTSNSRVSVDLLHMDALRTSASNASRAIRAAASTLAHAGYEEFSRAMAKLGDGFEAFGGLERDKTIAALEEAVALWASLVAPAAIGAFWWSDIARTQRELAEALSAWLDGVGAGGAVAENLSPEREPLRVAARAALLAASDAATARAGDVATAHWEEQARAARALATASADTDRVTHAGTAGSGPLAGRTERDLDERQLQITAAAAASSWFAAAALWSDMGLDDVANACRSSAVAIGAVSVLDGITAATLGWAAREAWRGVGM